MRLIDALLSIASTYEGATGLSASRVSTIVFNDGKILDRLRTGADITVGRAERAIQWFSDNWPAELTWPQGVPRPKPAEAPVAVAE